MTAPNMATITESLERSLQNCSLNHHQRSSSGSSSSSGSNSSRLDASGSRIGRSDSPKNHLRCDFSNSSDGSLELNSQISLPYHWEQCLDLKSGEIYYINWRTGAKVKEDPRSTSENFSGDYYSEDDTSYDSEESSTSESSPSPSREIGSPHHLYHHHHHQPPHNAHVLVVAGCKSCLMYFMVPKDVEDCPKCCGQLLHFDRSENASP